jgi:organic hydroperoxide reductase OsmC/OhrA
MSKQHHYTTGLRWTGNQGTGTSNYKDFQRSHSIKVSGKPEIQGSSDPSFRGDKTKYNPEELFLSSLSSCHMLWYLHLCAVNEVRVVDYTDQATATMEENTDGGGKFIEVILHPKVIVEEQGMIEKAMALHKEANEKCFIANSVNFTVIHRPSCKVSNSVG